MSIEHIITRTSSFPGSELVTIAVTCYNQQEELLLHLSKLSIILPPSFRILVLDDASDTPWSAGAFESSVNIDIFRLTKNRGPGSVRNIAISIATSKWITFLDGDDLLSLDPRVWLSLENHLSSSKCSLVLTNTYRQSRLEKMLLACLSSPAISSRVIIWFLSCMQLCNKVTHSGKFFNLSWVKSHGISFSSKRLYEDIRWHFLTVLSLPTLDVCPLDVYFVQEDPSSRCRRPTSLAVASSFFLNILSEILSLSIRRPFGLVTSLFYLPRISLAFIASCLRLAFRSVKGR
jgi:hypothetical protein